ncbi:MAG: ADP-ribosylation factor-directed GTPase activating protein isoform b [Pirellulaceae bacterium]
MWFRWACVWAMLCCFGCEPQTNVRSTSPDHVNVANSPVGGTAELPSTDLDRQLNDRLDRVLEFTLNHRLLDVNEHGAWQILHGVLAYQHDFPVQTPNGLQPAVDYVLNGGDIHGWTMQPGDVLDPATGRRGLRAIMEPGTKIGQGHSDQWLAILAQCHLPTNQIIRVGNAEYTMESFVQQVQMDVWQNREREWSWTLIGLSLYLPKDASWVATDRQTWSVEKLVESEVQQDLDASACGGTHRLIGLAMALNRHVAQGGQVTGPWADAQRLIRDAIERTRQYQNPDGSFSTNYFARPSNSPDVKNRLGATGHILEFLSVALPQEELESEWVKRAAWRLCQLFDDTRDLALECGALYHAAHGLVLYRERIYGQRSYRTSLNQRATVQ